MVAGLAELVCFHLGWKYLVLLLDADYDSGWANYHLPRISSCNVSFRVVDTNSLNANAIVELLMIDTFTSTHNTVLSTRSFRLLAEVTARSPGLNFPLCSWNRRWLVLPSLQETDDISMELSYSECHVCRLIKMGSNYHLQFWTTGFSWKWIGQSDQEGRWTRSRACFREERPMQFQGKRVRITMEKHFPFFLPSFEKYTGVDIEILSALQIVLNFSASVTRPPDARWGSQTTTGEWSGMIGLIHRKRADLALGGMTVSLDRMTAVDFSNYYLNDRLTFAVSVPGQADRTWDIILPFSWKVWVTLVFAVFFTALCLTATDKLAVHIRRSRITSDTVSKRQEIPRDSSAQSISLRNAIFYVFKALVMQECYDPTSSPSRLVVSTWWIFTVTTLAGYTSLLLSFLTCPRSQVPVDTINMLVTEIRKGAFKCGTIKDSADHNNFKGAENPAFQSILLSMESDPENFVKSDLEGLRKCLDSNYAYIAGELTVLADMWNPRVFLFARDSFRLSGYALAISKEFWYREVLDIWVLRLRESGLVDYWTRSIIAKTQKNQEVDIEDHRPLKLEEIQCSFCVWAVGMGIASFSMLVSIIMWKLSASSTGNQEQSPILQNRGKEMYLQ